MPWCPHISVKSNMFSPCGKCNTINEVSCFRFILHCKCIVGLFVCFYPCDTAVIRIPVCIFIKPQNTSYRNPQTFSTSYKLIWNFNQPLAFVAIPQHLLMHKLHSLILEINTARILTAAKNFSPIYHFHSQAANNFIISLSLSLAHTHTHTQIQTLKTIKPPWTLLIPLMITNPLIHYFFACN